MSILGILFGLVLWLLPMILSGVLAKHQGRSVLLWVVLSLFFGWIPTIILIVLGLIA